MTTSFSATTHQLGKGIDAPGDTRDVPEVEQVLQVEELGLGHSVLMGLCQKVADVNLLAAGPLPRDGVLRDTAGLDAVHQSAEA